MEQLHELEEANRTLKNMLRELNTAEIPATFRSAVSEDHHPG